MSLLFKVVFASHARGTHHKLVLDSLRQLQGADVTLWEELLLSEYSALLEGAKAPDDEFRDFKNHVLHVRENFWGGALNSAAYWYGQLVDHLRGQEWKESAYAYGVLSHYYSDPLMPLHTGQSESEGAVHRAAEWSVSKSYEKLRELLETELGGYPQVEVPAVSDWLSEMLRAGAVRANAYYDLLIDHYQLELGVKDPPAGLDRACQEAVADCLGYAIVGLARILERAIQESGMPPAPVQMPLKSVLAAAKIPMRQVMNRLADARDRRVVEEIMREVQETGKAIHSLPDSERLVRQFHAEEVLKVPLRVLDAEKARPSGRFYGHPAETTRRNTAARVPLQQPVAVSTPAESVQSVVPKPSEEKSSEEKSSEEKSSEEKSSEEKSSEEKSSEEKPSVEKPSVEKPSVEKSVLRPATRSVPKFYLKPEAPIVDAPSIGPKTAARFEQIGLHTVGDLLNADPEKTVGLLGTRNVTAEVLMDWQCQSQLMISVPGLRGHDAQLLVAAGVRPAEQLRSSRAASLLQEIVAVCETSEGRKILRDGKTPDLQEVSDWIANSNQMFTPHFA
jgi:hypothetical protein